VWNNLQIVAGFKPVANNKCVRRVGTTQPAAAGFFLHEK
jgi:hypothetical protein